MKLIYDVQSVPPQAGIANVIKIFEHHKVVLWDSSLGVKPSFVTDGLEPNESNIQIVDTEGKEFDIAYWEKKFKDEKYWSEELYKVKKSPLYYFRNYGTVRFPVVQEDVTNFLQSLGLGTDQSAKATGDDHEAATEEWNKKKQLAEESMKDITIEHLQERQVVVELMKEEYNTTVLALESQVKDSVRLFDSNNEPLEPRKQIENLAKRIRKCYPIPPDYSSYVTKKGKWDGAMLHATPYAELLRMFKAVVVMDEPVTPLVVKK